MPVYFQNPEWFSLIPVLIIIKLIFSRLAASKIQPVLAEYTSVYLPHLTATEIKRSRHNAGIKSIVNWLVIILMTTALAQPVSRIRIQANPDSLRDIIFVIDTSVGMSINDYELGNNEVDRLTLLKAVLTDFVKNLEGNRMGLMVYADRAYTLSPLTRDKQLLEFNINRITPALAGRQNNLSNALNTVIKQYDFSDKKPSVVIMSQGANLEGDINPLTVARNFKERNIKLHFIGLGSVNKITNTKVSLIYDPIDDKLLRKLSEITGGEFFWAGKSDNLNSILNAIKKTEKFDVKLSDLYRITDHYIWMMYLVLTILSGSMLFNMFRKRSK